MKLELIFDSNNAAFGTGTCSWLIKIIVWLFIILVILSAGLMLCNKDEVHFMAPFKKTQLLMGQLSATWNVLHIFSSFIFNGAFKNFIKYQRMWAQVCIWCVFLLLFFGEKSRTTQIPLLLVKIKTSKTGLCST